MKLERVIHPDQIRDGINALVSELLDALSRSLSEGAKVTIEILPATELQQIDRPTVTMDFTRHHVEGVLSYTCCCGWETHDTVALTQHLERHGARRVEVTPTNWEPEP